MKPCFPSAAKLGRRSDIVPDVNHVQAGRVLELPSPILGDERIDVCELIHGFLARLETSDQLARFLFGNPAFRELPDQGMFGEWRGNRPRCSVLNRVRIGLFSFLIVRCCAIASNLGGCGPWCRCGGRVRGIQCAQRIFRVAGFFFRSSILGSFYLGVRGSWFFAFGFLVRAADRTFRVFPVSRRNSSSSGGLGCLGRACCCRRSSCRRSSFLISVGQIVTLTGQIVILSEGE